MVPRYSSSAFWHFSRFSSIFSSFSSTLSRVQASTTLRIEEDSAMSSRKSWSMVSKRLESSGSWARISLGQAMVTSSEPGPGLASGIEPSVSRVPGQCGYDTVPGQYGYHFNTRSDSCLREDGLRDNGTLGSDRLSVLTRTCYIGMDVLEKDMRRYMGRSR